MESTTPLVDRDAQCVWHPFTQAKTAASPLPIVRGEGSYLIAEDGSRYLDAIASWWVNLHGHGHPYIAQKISQQAFDLEHVMFGGFTHEPAVALAEKLISLLPPCTRVFYNDNGATAIETALKMAIQYWWNKKIPKSRIICLKDGYHGDTFGAMSASGKMTFQRPFWPYLFDVEIIDPPLLGKEETSLDQMHDILRKGDVAFFIYEPIIQGWGGGMRIYSATGLNALLKMCKRYEALTIVDEVMTGFGRTGPLFASDALEEKPDIICLSKGITGGFLPLGATLCREFIYQGFYSENLENALLHGHSYCGNPLCCAAALASLDLLLTEECSAQRKMIEFHHRTFCQAVNGHPKLKRSETLGTILVLEYAAEGDYLFSNLRHRLYNFFIKNKILIRPFGNVIHLMPPYCITAEELEQIYDHIKTTLRNDTW